MAKDSFSSQDDFILNYRPKIEFVEPEQVEVPPPEEPPAAPLEEARTQVQDLVTGLKQVAALADATQKRIDQRVQASGGLSIKLDPQKDYAVIAAMKRRFPEKTDPTVITYEDYRKALDCMQVAAPPIAKVSPDDILAAQSNPLRTDFGGYSNQQGENRPEISSDANSIQPLDLEAFQKDAVVSLYSLIRPLVIDDIIKKIADAIGF